MSNHESSDDFLDRSEDESSSSGQESDASTCISFVHQNVVVEATVTIKPRVILGEDFTIQCGESSIIKMEKKHPHPHPPKPRPHEGPKPKGPKPGKKEHDEECNFVVQQELFIKIPLIFSAEAKVTNEEAICLNPETNSCAPEDESSSSSSSS